MRDVEILQKVGDLLAPALGDEPMHVAAIQRAKVVLAGIRQASDRALSKWPEDARFRYQVIDLSPAVARQIMRYGAFAIGAGDPKVKTRDKNRERVSLGEEGEYSFAVVRRGDEWWVERFYSK